MVKFLSHNVLKDYKSCPFGESACQQMGDLEVSWGGLTSSLGFICEIKSIIQ